MMIAKDTVKRNKHYRCIEYEHEQTCDLYLVGSGVERVDSGVSYGPEKRDCYHLHVILSGAGTLQVQGKVWHLHFGQMFLLKHDEVVQYTADEENPWEYCWISYNGKKAKWISEEIGFTEGVYCLDSAVSAQEFFAMVGRLHEHMEMNYINELRRTGILFEFLALAMESTGIRKKKQEYHAECSSEVYVRRALEFIHSNYSVVRVGDIVKYLGFSRSYFSSFFHKYTGVSPQEYIIQYRLQQSCHFLETTDMTIKDIALKIGYDSGLNFSRAFKKVYGVSPKMYRQNLQKDSN
jgi:AraC family transcriptional regulator of arabinose operon